MRYKYNVLNYNLTNGLNEEVQVPGGFIYMKDATDLSVKIAVRPDSKTNDAVYLKKQFGIVVGFKKLYITADAQANKTVELLVTDSYDTFRIFEQAQIQDINSVASITNPVTVASVTNPVTIANPTIADILKVGGTTQTGWDLQKLQKNLDAEYGTQTIKYNIIGTGGIIIIHTVATGKNLLLENVGMQISNQSGNYSTGGVYVRDSADVLIYRLFYFDLPNAQSLSEDKNVSLIIPSGFDICLHGDASGMKVSAFIKGREF
jgi:hypothetical protein